MKGELVANHHNSSNYKVKLASMLAMINLLNALIRLMEEG